MSRPPTLRLPSTARPGRLATERGEFAVLWSEERPDAEPRYGTALLVPGFTGSKEDFLPLLEPLARAGFRVCAVDGRGQYQSAGPREESAYAQEELVRDVLAQTRALGGTAHLLGHSFGGQVCRAAVLADPEPFASLTLLSSGPGAVHADQRARLEVLGPALRQLPMEKIWQMISQMDPPEAPGQETPAEVREFLRDRWLGTEPAQLLAAGAQLLVEPDRSEELSASGVPVHVVSGERDYAWPVESLADMAKRLDAPHTVIEGAEHSPNVERPEVTAEALADFWRRHAG
ncbi:alpha/beta hydrolase [Streptomyces sp. NPDC005438]|uniref:alpha/beta fold hydrolase n=1 Tax=Streptomyces sp. NPDC005438 TaxID=3156880 RepID=UPI0033BA0841